MFSRLLFCISSPFCVSKLDIDALKYSETVPFETQTK